MSEPTTRPDDRPSVFVVVETAWPTDDVAGCLVLETGQVLWSHMSSNIGWLQRDLTTSFYDRRVKLEALFPAGYQTVVIGPDDQLPAAVSAANEAWAAAGYPLVSPSVGG